MHSRHDDPARGAAYLSDIAKGMVRMPVRERADALREMREHLTALAAEERTLGVSAAEAIARAQERFGPPEEIADGLIAAWERQRAAERRSLFGAVALAALLLAVVNALLRLLVPWPHPHSLAEAWHQYYVSLMTATVTTVGIGLTVGLFFPRRAPSAVMLVLFGWWLARGVMEWTSFMRPLELPAIYYLDRFESFFAFPGTGLWSLVGGGTALLVQRLRAYRVQKVSFRPH